MPSFLDNYSKTLLWLFNESEITDENTQFFFSPRVAQTAQMAQTEEFMFKNVAYRATVYRTGGEGIRFWENRDIHSSD